MIDLVAGEATARIDPRAGGRVASLVVAGRERLVTGTIGDDPMLWGSYPMAPWAGRLRRGRLIYGGRAYHFPLDAPPHAIHGTVYRRAWVVDDDGSLVTSLGPTWPFPGHARQRVDLQPGRLQCTLEVHADEVPMPAAAGYHPWFAGPVELAVAPRHQLCRDADGLPDGTVVPPEERPWDDCFTGLSDPPRVIYPDGLAITVGSDVEHWVIFTPEHAVCVEPQTGPPNELNTAPRLVEPDAPLVVTMVLSWSA